MIQNFNCDWSVQFTKALVISYDQNLIPIFIFIIFFIRLEYFS